MKADGRRSGKPRIYLFLVVLLISTSGFIVTANEFRKTLVFYDILYLSSLIEGEGRVSDSAVQTATEEFIRDGGGGVCRADIVKSGATVLLLNLDQKNPETDYDAWERAAGQAQAFLKQAASCLPTDGNIWLRLAMVERAIGEQPARTAALIERSQRLAPAEKLILASRFALWNRLSAETLRLSNSALQSDLAVHKKYYWGKTIDALRQPRPAFAKAAGLPVKS